MTFKLVGTLVFVVAVAYGFWIRPALYAGAPAGPWAPSEISPLARVLVPLAFMAVVGCFIWLPGSKLVRVLITLFFVVMTPVSFWAARQIYTVNREGRIWPTTSATLLARDLEWMGSGGNTAAGESYAPRLKYQFEVNGRTYVSEQVYAVGRQSAGLKRQAERFVNELPTQIPVHYNPANPERCFLFFNKGRWFLLIALTFGGVAFTLAALVSLLMLLVPSAPGP